MFVNRNGEAVTIEQINEQIASGNPWVRFLFTSMERGFTSLTDGIFYMCSSVTISTDSRKPVRVHGGMVYAHVTINGGEHEIMVDPKGLDYVAW